MVVGGGVGGWLEPVFKSEGGCGIPKKGGKGWGWGLSWWGATKSKINRIRKSGVNQSRAGFWKWSGRKDLNLRPPGPEPGALARLRYAPTVRHVYHSDCAPAT